jgi:hypothetical protein
LTNRRIYSAWHNIWKSAGQPGSDTLHHIKCATKLIYKLAIRDSYIEFETKHNDEIYEHFTNKNPSELWKSWNSKFRRNINKRISIDGCHVDYEIANKFAEHFSNIYKRASNSDNLKVVIEDTGPADAVRYSDQINKLISVELNC